MTSSLPRKCSTTELRGHKKAHLSNPAKRWSGKRDSNPRPSAWKADALANWAIPASSTNLKIQDGEGRIRTSEGWADRFTVCSLWPLGNLPVILGKLSPHLNRHHSDQAPAKKNNPSQTSQLKLELAKGLEPPTCWLQISCSTNWAMPAQQIKNPHFTLWFTKLQLKLEAIRYKISNYRIFSRKADYGRHYNMTRYTLHTKKALPIK